MTLDVQDFSQHGQKSQDVWLVFMNEGIDTTYIFDCSNNATGLLAPFEGGTIVKNLLYPYDELTLGDSPQKLSKLQTHKSPNEDFELMLF